MICFGLLCAGSKPEFCTRPVARRLEDNYAERGMIEADRLEIADAEMIFAGYSTDAHLIWGEEVLRDATPGQRFVKSFHIPWDGSKEQFEEIERLVAEIKD